MKTRRLRLPGLTATIAGAALAAVIAGPAQSADMPLKAPPAPVPIHSWTGFYVGINGGYAWSGNRTTAFTPGDPFVQFLTCGGSESVAAAY